MSSHSHNHRTLLSPDALGGVLRLHVGGHSVLHGAGDVPLDHVRTVISGGNTRSKCTVICYIHWSICLWDTLARRKQWKVIKYLHPTLYGVKLPVLTKCQTQWQNTCVYPSTAIRIRIKFSTCGIENKVGLPTTTKKK